MAELATIARPYAEALYRVGAARSNPALAAQVDQIAALLADPQVRQFADNPRVGADQVLGFFSAALEKVSAGALVREVENFLRTLIDNGRLTALPEIAAQFRALRNAEQGVAEAVVTSAYPVTDDQLAQLPTLEKRFGSRLSPRVEVDPSLIGGVRVVVGDEVLDTSVKARLERMKVALTA